MKILLIIAFFMIFTLVFSLQIAYAEELYGNNANTGIFVAFDDGMSMIVYKSALGVSEHYDSVVKEWQHGGFMLKSPEIVIFGHPLENDKYMLVVITSMGFERFTVSSTNYSSPILNIPKEVEPKKTENSILEEYWKNRENTTIRESEKQVEIIEENVKREMVIVTQIPNRIPWESMFNFDLKVFDADTNPLRDYYFNDGKIKNVNVTATVKDPTGADLLSVNGVTSKFGHYSGKVYVPWNSNINGPFTFEVLATHQLDGQTLTASLLKEFFVFAPTDTGIKSCEQGYIRNGTAFCVLICPVTHFFNATGLCELKIKEVKE